VALARGFNIFNQVNRGGNFEESANSINFGEPTGAIETNQFQAQFGVRFSF